MPNFPSAPACAPTPGPDERNVVSCFAKSRARILMIPDATRSAVSSPPSGTCPRSTRVNSVVVSFQTSKPASFLTTLKPVIVSGWPTESRNHSR